MRLSAKGKRKLLGMAALIALLAVLTYLVLTNYVFIAKDVRVVGNETLTAEEIIRAAKLPLGKKMSEVDEDAVRQALNSSGVVELLELEKAYPSQIVLTVRERAREAVISHAGVVLTLERDATVIERLDAMPETDAVYVTGLGVTGYRLGEVIYAPEDQRAAMCEALNAIYENDARAYVSELNVSDPNAVYIYSRTGMRVELGDGENMNSKILWMVEALKDLESRGELTGTLDVSSGSKADYSPE